MKHLIVLVLVTTIGITTYGQTVKENTTPLSKAAKKGFLDETIVDADGNVRLIYQMKGGGKDEILYEEYDFGADLSLKETKPVSVQKEIKPDMEKERMAAWVGACSSFDINSMRLRISRDKVKLVWNYKKQYYERKKTLESETIKLKNEKGNSYYGIDEFYDEVDDKIAVLVFTETKDKANPRKYALVKFGTSGEPEESLLDITGAYSIVYTQKVTDFRTDEQGLVAVFAPQTGDLSKYLMIHYDLRGNLKSKVEFNSPSLNMLVISVVMSEGAFYLYGTSIESKAGYYREFDDYQPMRNPCYDGYANYAMVSFTKKADQTMDNFHFIKIMDGKLQFASTAPFSSLKGKMKTPPSQKGGTPYKGKKFIATAFKLTPAGEYLLSGQIGGWGMLRGGSSGGLYKDIVCLHFTKNGEFKAQYAVDRLDTDNKSEIFQVEQNFYSSPDGKSVLWEIRDVKGTSGYANYWDALSETRSFYPHEYPRVGKIDLEGTSLSDFQVLGDKKFYINSTRYIAKTNSLLYVGRDIDESRIWLATIRLD